MNTNEDILNWYEILYTHGKKYGVFITLSVTLFEESVIGEAQGSSLVLSEMNSRRLLMRFLVSNIFNGKIKGQ